MWYNISYYFYIIIWFWLEKFYTANFEALHSWLHASYRSNGTFRHTHNNSSNRDSKVKQSDQQLYELQNLNYSYIDCYNIIISLLEWKWE